MLARSRLWSSPAGPSADACSAQSHKFLRRRVTCTLDRSNEDRWVDIAIVRRPQEDQAMSRTRIISASIAALMSLALAGAPAFAADDMKKDGMSKDSMSKDTMSKDSMSKDNMKK